MKISKRTVDAIRPVPGGDRFKWDEALKGFGVRMKPSGIGSYLIQYRNPEGRTRRLVLGRVGVLTPDEARTLARDRLSEVAKGGDPSGERRDQRKALTVSEMCDQYLADAEAGRIVGRGGRPIKATTLAMDRSRIEQHVKPLLGRRAVSSLTLRDIEDMQAAIAVGKTARARPATGRTGRTSGGRGVASRTVGMLAAIMAHARIPNNPARGVRRYADGKSKAFLTIQQIEALGRAIREAELEGKSRSGIAAVRALMLTGCRKNEILALPWEWFDEGARCLRLGDSKTGEAIRPLGAAAVQFLACRPRHSYWVFPAGKGDGHFTAVSRILAELCQRADVPTVSPHVLRHTFASIAAELGFSELVIAGLLGHAAKGVTQRYSHLPDTALLAAADRVAARISAALDGISEAKVLPMRSHVVRA